MPGEETKLAVSGLIRAYAAELAQIARYLRDDSSKPVALLAADRIDDLAGALCADFTDATGVGLPLIEK